MLIVLFNDSIQLGIIIFLRMNEKTTVLGMLRVYLKQMKQIGRQDVKRVIYILVWISCLHNIYIYIYFIIYIYIFHIYIYIWKSFTAHFIIYGGQNPFSFFASSYYFLHLCYDFLVILFGQRNITNYNTVGWCALVQKWNMSYDETEENIWVHCKVKFRYL